MGAWRPHVLRKGRADKQKSFHRRRLRMQRPSRQKLNPIGAHMLKSSTAPRAQCRSEGHRMRAQTVQISMLGFPSNRQSLATCRATPKRGAMRNRKLVARQEGSLRNCSRDASSRRRPS